jgi:hypothetical protein
MRTIGVPMLGLAIAVLLGVAAASATASPLWEQCKKGATGTKYESGQCLKAASAGEWAWQEAAGTEKVTLTGTTLTLADTKTALGETEVQCTKGIEGEGQVAAAGKGKVSKFEVKEAEKNCTAVKGGCEAGHVEKVTGAHLPWNIELYETEKRVLTKVESASPGTEKEAGWTVTCKTILGSKTDTCESEGTSEAEGLVFQSTTSGEKSLVAATFEKTHKAKCSEGGKEAGEAEGTANVEGTGGNGIRIAAKASEVIAFLWRVAGAMLGVGQNREISSATLASVAGKKFGIEGTTNTQIFNLECEKVKGKAGNSPRISGGLPGTIIAPLMELEKCSVLTPTGCTIKQPIEVRPSGGEIGEGVGTSLGVTVVNQVETAKIEFEKIPQCKTLEGRTVEVGNKVLAAIPYEEKAVQDFKLEPEVFREYRNFRGELRPAGLRVIGEPSNRVRFTGEIEMTLTSTLGFGPL